MRIFMITGLGEDAFIFDHIQTQLPGEKIVLSLWQLLPDYPVPGLNVAQFADELIERFQITRQDLIIGHSTGGWVALHIKQRVNCLIIQLASWTNRRKVASPMVNRHLIYRAAQTGLYFNGFVLRYLIRTYYHDKPSRLVFERVFRRLITGSRANAVNQLRLIFNPFTEPVTVEPDLRIHARADGVVRFPDGPVQQVPGDHFSLYTYPEAVLAVITEFLKTRMGEGKGW